MKFICDPHGKLLKGAPGNYECGKIYMQPYHMSEFAFWELVEDIPTLKIPEVEEKFEDAFYVPDDEPKIDLSGGAILEDSTTFNYDFSKVMLEASSPEVPLEISPEVEPTRDDLIDILVAHNVEFSKHHSTKHLKKLVDSLEEDQSSTSDS
jgi:hypothetical protein